MWSVFTARYEYSEISCGLMLVLKNAVSCQVCVVSMIQERVWISVGVLLTGQVPWHLERNISPRLFDHHKSHTECPGITQSPPRGEAGELPPETWQDARRMG